MSVYPIRVLAVLADVGRGEDLLAQLDERVGVEVVGVANSRRSALQQAESCHPDVLLVDLMLPGYRSIEIIETVVATQPEVRVLALSPADPASDRVAMAFRAGARGYVCRDAQTCDLVAALEGVHRGELWLPREDTVEVLRDLAPDLAVSAEERRSRLGGILLGLIPLSGLVAAITAFLWREYWSQIGVRVTDLGIDPSTRVTDLFVVLLAFLGVFGPLLFVDAWLQGIGRWVGRRPRLSAALTQARGFHLGRVAVGRLLTHRWLAWLAIALFVVASGFLLQRLAPLLIILFLGPGVAIVLLANLLGLDDQLPEFLPRPRVSGRVLLVLGLFTALFLVALGAEVLVEGPDLRRDGMHGVLAPQVLGLSARPVMLYDLNGQYEPLGALYLGGNADLYVLYDPCAEVVNLVPVGSSRVKLVDEVPCQ